MCLPRVRFRSPKACFFLFLLLSLPSLLCRLSRPSVCKMCDMYVREGSESIYIYMDGDCYVVSYIYIDS